MTDAVPAFTATAFAHEGREHEVFWAGTGPAVIVIHEMPGLHPGVTAFGQRLVDEGFTVYLPSLFGRPGAPFAGREMLRTLPRVCVSRQFAMLADRTSPVASWLRALAAKAHAECGGPGVGAVGMCFTGGFALAMAVEPAVLASVLSQPGLPAPVNARHRAAVGLDPADLATIKARTQRTQRIEETGRTDETGQSQETGQETGQTRRTQDGLCVLGLRFSADKGSPPERFETLRRELGDAFEGIEIDSSPGNPAGIPARAHSVLTVDLVDEPGHPTRLALDRVLAFLTERLAATP
jgi:dienelactone hydrolase